jgi:hypothetical protein
MGKKRALLVAINDYVGQANDLPSCVNDAHAIENLVKNDFGFTDTKALFDSAATIANVEQGLTWLFDNVAFDDNLLFFYSGHGYQMPNGNVLEESLVLYDGFWADDKLSALTQPLPTGVLTVILDSCFSGGLEKKLKDFIAASQETTWVKWWTPETGEQLIHDIDVDKTVKQFRPFGCFPVETNMSVKSLAKAFKNRQFKSELHHCPILFHRIPRMGFDSQDIFEDDC